MSETPGEKLRRLIKGTRVETPITPAAEKTSQTVPPEEPFISEETARAILEQAARDKQAAADRANAPKVPNLITVESDEAEIKRIKDAHTLKRNAGFKRRPIPK